MHYLAFGLLVASDFELPGLPEVDAGDTSADVHIVRGPIPTLVEAVDSGGGEPRSIVHGRAAGLLRTRIERGTQMMVDPEPDAEPTFLAAVIAGELMSVLLRQRGLLVLHGSAVARDGQAVGLLGHSGWGKSTSAAALLRDGWRLLTDDVLAVDLSGEQPRVIPGHASMRLAPDSAGHLVPVPTDLPIAHAQTLKRRVGWADSFDSGTLPLARLYVLEPRTASEHRIEPLGLQAAVHTLVEHTRGTRMLTSAAERGTHLRQCAALVRTVGVAQLRRRMGFEHLPDLCTLIDLDVRSHGDATPADLRVREP